MQQVLGYSYKSIITYQCVTVLIGKLKNGIQYIKLKKIVKNNKNCINKLH